MIKFVDMFSGIGGFREGLIHAGGFECVGHCEIDKWQSYRNKANFPKMVAAACIINDGSSDDRFTDFRNWLIIQGYDAYRQALIDPDNLAALNIPFRDTEWMGCGNVAWYAYAGQKLHTYFEKEGIAAKLFRKYPALLKSSADLHQAIMQEQLVPHRAPETEWERQMLRTEVKHYIDTSGLAYSYNEFYIGQKAPPGIAVVQTLLLRHSQYPKEAGAWNPPAVQSILTNEKYRGDTCCQKRYTPDTLPLQKKRNKSQLPKYYIQESHPAIIMPTDFAKVQALLSQKRTHRSQMHSYPLTKMAVCQFCGKMLSPKTRANGMRVWNCKTHIVDSTQCPIKPVYETELYGAFLSMYNKLFENRATLFLPIFNDLQRIQDIKSMQNEASNVVHTEILQISKQLHNLTRIHAQGYIEETVYQERRIRIEQQLAEKKKCLTCQKQNGTVEKALYQTKQIDRYMQNHTALTEFDEEAMRTIVKKIVVSNEAFVFELPNGLHLKEKR